MLDAVDVELLQWVWCWVEVAGLQSEYIAYYQWLRVDFGDNSATFVGLNFWRMVSDWCST